MRSFILVNFTVIIRVIKSRTMRRTEHIAHMVEMKNAYKIFVERHGGKIPLVRPRRRW
jgi:hypothetical protein